MVLAEAKIAGIRETWVKEEGELDEGERLEATKLCSPRRFGKAMTRGSLFDAAREECFT